MKRIISILMAMTLMLLCVGCETSNTNSSNSSSYSPPSSLTVPSYDFDDDFDFEFSEDFELTEDDEEYSGITVYVSRTGKIHSNPRCSGMKYYTEMDYDEAVDNGYDFCMNCY